MTARQQRRGLWMGLGAATLAVLMGCTAGKNKANVELIDDMMDQVNVKAQDWDPDRPDKRANFVPPEHSIPRGFSPYKYPFKPQEAEAALINPLANDMSPKVIELGKAKFDIYCAVCHGASGHGDGLVGTKMLIAPPSLLSDKVKVFRDGRIFHIITDGQGLMGSYASQLHDEKSRWAIVNYVRTLQKQGN